MISQSDLFERINAIPKRITRREIPINLTFIILYAALSSYLRPILKRKIPNNAMAIPITLVQIISPFNLDLIFVLRFRRSVLRLKTLSIIKLLVKNHKEPHFSFVSSLMGLFQAFISSVSVMPLFTSTIMPSLRPSTTSRRSYLPSPTATST